MARHRVNPQQIKIHRTYTVEEAARALGVHKNSVRNWRKQGLQPIDSGHPILFLGLELKRFVEGRRRAAKRPCPPGQIYCVRCRAPKAPAEGMVDYLPQTPSSGNLRGICPDCGTLIHRRISLAQLNAISGILEIAFPDAPERIRDSWEASENCGSRRDDENHGNA